MNKLTLSRSNDDVHRLLVKQGEHVGNLKLYSRYGRWRLLNYEPNDGVIPGRSPLTDRHNATFLALDEALICAPLPPT